MIKISKNLFEVTISKSCELNLDCFSFMFKNDNCYDCDYYKQSIYYYSTEQFKTNLFKLFKINGIIL